MNESLGHHGGHGRGLDPGLGEAEANLHLVLLHRCHRRDQQGLGDSGEAGGALARPDHPRFDAGLDAALGRIQPCIDDRSAARTIPDHLRGGEGRGAVHEAEMGHVDRVLSHVLQAAEHPPFVDLIVGPVGIGRLREGFQFPLGRNAERVIPEPDHPVGFRHRPLVIAGLAQARRNGLGIGDVVHHALPVIAPGVKRTFEMVAGHPSAVTHVRPKMTAMGVDHPRHAVMTAPHREVPSEIPQRLDLPDGQLFAEQGRKPAMGKRHVEVALGDGGPARDIGGAPAGTLLPGHVRQGRGHRDRGSIRLAAGIIGHGHSPPGGSTAARALGRTVKVKRPAASRRRRRSAGRRPAIRRPAG